MSLFVLFLFFTGFLFGQSFNHVTVIDTSFDNGSLGGWGPRGSVQQGLERVELDTSVKRSGAASMRISNRTKTWQGPVHKLTDNAVAGDVYSMSAWIYYNEGPAMSPFVLSVQRSFKDTSKAHAYQNITSFQVRRGEWTEIKTEYTVGADPTQASIWVYFELPFKEDHLVTPNDRITFWMDDIKFIKLDPASRPKAELNIPNLADIWAPHFDIGTAVTRDEVDFSSPTAQILMKHFTVLVAGNEQKMESIQPEEGKFDWAPADAIINFGEMTGMRFRWHTLVWHTQNPAWLFQESANSTRTVSRNVLNQRLRTYIQTVMRRYRGRVESYDVVNEVLSDRSGLRTGAEGSRWHEILGPEYIDNAFRWAKEADPTAQLVINDYNLESDTRKRQEMFNLVKGMKERGVPVDAIGIQMHINIRTPSVQQIRETIELFASLGVKVMVTELDISIYTSDTEPIKNVTPALLLEQAQRYKDIFAMLREQSQKGNLADMVVIWGTTDHTSWKNDFPVRGRTDAPLLFDGRYQSKPAFWALVQPTRVQGLR